MVVVSMRGAAVVGALLLCGCGFLQRRGAAQEESERPRMVEIPLVASVRPGVVFRLAPTFALDRLQVAASDVIIDIKGCVSGFNPQDIDDASVRLYYADNGCIAELQEFTYGGDGPFTSLTPVSAKDASAIYTFGGREVRVTVEDNIEGEVSDTDVVRFVFQEVLDGADAVITDYDATVGLEVEGVEAPNLGISAMTLFDVDATDGNGIFDVVFDCGAPGGAHSTGNNCPTALAVNQDMTLMSAVIVPDTYGSDMTYAEAEAAFSLPGVNVVSVNQVAIDDAAATDGFKLRLEMPATAKLYANLHMMIVLRYEDPAASDLVSYRYFNADLEDLATP